MQSDRQKPITLEKISANIFHVAYGGNHIGQIQSYTNPFHGQNQYLQLHFAAYDPLWARELFSLLQDDIRKPLQIMLSSQDVKQSAFLLAGGFQCKRKCCEMEVSKNDLAISIKGMPLDSASSGSPAYTTCSQLMYDYYKRTHAEINPLTADYPAFCTALPKDAFFQKTDGEIKHFAFVEDNEIAYIGSADAAHVKPFAESLVSALFRKFETIHFECDNCDIAAMTLRQLFSNLTEEAFDTYILC